VTGTLANVQTGMVVARSGHSLNEFFCTGFGGLYEPLILHMLPASVQCTVENAFSGIIIENHKTKYMVMARDQNAGRSHNMKIDNSSIGSVEELKYLGTTLTNQNSIQVEIKSGLKLGNA
jgi:hypothetical protein